MMRTYLNSMTHYFSETPPGTVRNKPSAQRLEMSKNGPTGSGGQFSLPAARRSPHVLILCYVLQNEAN